MIATEYSKQQNVTYHQYNVDMLDNWSLDKGSSRFSMELIEKLFEEKNHKSNCYRKPMRKLQFWRTPILKYTTYYSDCIAQTVRTEEYPRKANKYKRYKPMYELLKAYIFGFTYANCFFYTQQPTV